MPNILAPIQGIKNFQKIPVLAKNGGEKRDEFGNTITKENVDTSSIKMVQDC